ncbi:MAG: DegT/DnrJ/EryC1/StrS family aminotransferase [Candidatus Peregrinibacteria bacterium]
MNVPVNEPIITEEAKRNVQEALDSGWVSSAGPFIDAFEKEFAQIIGVKHAITTTSGTTALHLALAALNIGPGDEVIVPDFTMIASPFAVLYTGATPTFVDCDREIFAIDPEKIEAAITPRTKAIMPVHLFGHPADMDPIRAIAKKYHLAVLEDAAEAHGAMYRGKRCGALGDIAAFSFYGNKIITTGEGGMVTTDDDALAAKARALKDLAHTPGKRFTHSQLGYNYRMTNMQAGLGLGQLQHLDEFIAKKQWMADAYATGLRNIKGLRLPVTKPWAKNVYWMEAILVEDDFGMSRDQLRKELLARGIDTRDFFTSSAAQPAIRDLRPPQGPFPVTEDIAKRGFYLPSGLALTEEQIEYVCECMKEIAARSKNM